MYTIIVHIAHKKQSTAKPVEASYLDIVQALDDHGIYGVKKDLEQLFRRVVFNILVSTSRRPSAQPWVFRHAGRHSAHANL
ncbi:MAG: HipA domain-containing protein [Nitrococcus sp.]|nr:HipA domain-containing protein [Nitrococcus sp.]